MTIPIKPASGLRLEPTEIQGIARAVVDDFDAKRKLSWDRFVRLQAAAEALKNILPSTDVHVLDAGGYDGALALFLPGLRMDVIDPATTDGSILDMPVPDATYDAICSIDVIEHLEPGSRSRCLRELARAAKGTVVLNYPCRASRDAQILALKLTQNSLIKEHVQWELPDTNQVIEEMARYGFRAELREHTSIAVWLGQYTFMNAEPESAAELNRFLVDHFADEPTTQPLYHLLVLSRN